MLKLKKVESNSDYQKVLKIREIVFVGEQKVPRHLEIDENEKMAIYFLGLSDDLPVTTGRVRAIEDGIKFERIATLPEHRGKSYGKQLMEFMQEFCIKDFPGKEFYMYAQGGAISFYEQLGWKTIGEKFIEANIVHQKMIYS